MGDSLKVPASKKHRSVLGEITNPPDLASIPNKATQKKPKIDSQKKEDEDLKTEIGVSSIDSVKCAYSPSMFQHLHSLEVNCSNSVFNSLNWVIGFVDLDFAFGSGVME